MNILSQIKYSKSSIKFDELFYYDHVTEYPIANIADFDWKTILSSPEPNSSKKTYNELIEVYNKSQQRSKQQVDIIKKIDFNPNFYLLELLERLNLKFPVDVFQEMYHISYPILVNVKNLFNRARPYQLAKLYDMDIDLIVTSTHHTPSYPSGHTFYTRLGCNIVQNDYPNLKNELNKIVNITAECRILQGVHYRSDNTASIVLADYLYNYLKQKLYGLK
jgi:hypothetical protein